MYFLNVGHPEKTVAKLGTALGVALSEPLVLIDGYNFGYVLPVKGEGYPLKAVLYKIGSEDKLKSTLKITSKQLYEVKATLPDAKEFRAFVVASEPLQQLNLSFAHGARHTSKHIKGK